MKYPKINSLWMRKYENGKYSQGDNSLIEGAFALPEFRTISQWLVVEKIDGTNIRIHVTVEENSLTVDIFGRNEDSKVPESVIKALRNIDWLKAFNPGDNVWLFGEGYGPKIQTAGQYYREDVGFILFDIFANGWWLAQESVEEIAQKLSIPSAPVIGIMSTCEIVEYVKSKPTSWCSKTTQVMEGVVCRPEPLLLFRHREPVLMKLKCKDY